MMNRKAVIIITAPSGSGKTTIVRHLLRKMTSLSFSVSATTRKRRKNEKNGKDYYFLTNEEFDAKVENGAFVEWEEVYPGKRYGTLKAEIDRIWSSGKHVVFDVDVKGAVTLKDQFSKNSVAIFLKVPDIESLKSRLIRRNTESVGSLRERIRKYEDELKFEDRFDIVVVNDVLAETKSEVESIVKKYLENFDSRNYTRDQGGC